MCSCHSLFSAQAWPYDWARVGANQTENGVTRIEKAGSERELLSLFLTRLHKLKQEELGPQLFGCLLSRIAAKDSL